MPDFEFRNPMENKKLQPFLVVGVVLVVIYVLFIKRTTGTAGYSDTEYQATYATNTGITTEVSNMMEDYKQTFQTMLDDSQTATDDKIESQNEQLLLYMEELNTMFDSKMTSFESDYDANMRELENELSGKITGMESSISSTLEGLKSSVSNIQAEQNRQDKLAAERTQANKTSGVLKNYASNPSSGMKDYGDYNITNGRDSNYNDDGSAFLTSGLLDYLADMSGNSSSSHSDYRNAETKYYFEDASGRVYDSAVDSMSQITDSTGKTTTTIKHSDGKQSTVERTNTGSLTETITTRPDGTKLVTYSPNKK